MSSDFAQTETLVDDSSYSGFDRSLRTRLFKQLADLRECELSVEDSLGTVVLGRPAEDQALTLRAHISVDDPEFYRSIAGNGSVGAGEAYMAGHWSCEQLTVLVQILLRNRHLLDAMEGGPARIAGWMMRAWHMLRRNTRRGSQRNIAAHYDLGNDLFALFLDSGLMYSSAIFANPDESIEIAAQRKLERICKKLDLKASDQVLEIGSGWGGFAIYAARHYGCCVTTTTISHEQATLARQRIDQAGLSERITVLEQDYRDLRGSYDKLVSIEMIEAIGHQYQEVFFGKLASLLKDDGLALLQAITIEDHRYAQALKSVDFIKRHIFPGSFIPALSSLLGAAARVSDLRLTHLEDIGPSYALTLKAWRGRFLAQLPQVRELGYDERFVRMWEFYLCYCEGGFLERSTGCVQMLMARPRNRRAPFLPDLIVN